MLQWLTSTIGSRISYKCVGVREHHLCLCFCWYSFHFVYCALRQCLGNLPEMNEWFEKCISNNVPPTAVRKSVCSCTHVYIFFKGTIRVILDALGRDNPQNMEQFLQRARQMNFPFSIGCYMTLIELYGRAKNIQRVKEVQKEMEDRGLVPDRKTLELLLELFASLVSLVLTSSFVLPEWSFICLWFISNFFLHCWCWIRIYWMNWGAFCNKWRLVSVTFVCDH